MSGRARGRVATTLTITTMVLLALPALAVGVGEAAAAHPQVVPIGDLPTAWAYGAYRTVNVTGSGHDSQGPYSYSLRAYYGIQVVLNQTNLSATQNQVEIQRTLGATAYWTYCRPTCVAALVTANITVKALEQGAGFANLTTAGLVYENGTAVPGEAILDSFAETQASLQVSATATLHTLGGPRTSSLNAIENASASTRIDFTPSLGLYPTNLTTGTSWNASSSYVSLGSWNRAAHGSFTNFTGATGSWNTTTSGSITGNGTIALDGGDSGPLTLTDGSAVQSLELELTGPFIVREGLIFVPADADLLGPTSPAASEDGPAQADESAGTSSVGVGAHGGAHLGLLASASTFASASQGGSFASSSTPATGSASSGGTLVRPAAVPLAESSGPVILQAQPESVAAAEQSTACLVSGTCPIPAGPTAFRAVGLVLVGLVLLSVIAAALVVARRRELPAPPRPQAGLYPPVGDARASGTVTVPPGARGEPTPPPDEDPLSHLW